ncbi:MAG: disulfide bond formation protein DsbA [Phyllobacteriaceae bacterium]|nr:disulfide bond formation protein DsbA [Phyllobacteriaceae bacterium]MBA90888.1 disulfide bond formation protein DsbA [Phyllobacteriaceae bacterium]
MKSISIRTLAGLVAVPALALTLSACSDSGDGTRTSAADAGLQTVAAGKAPPAIDMTTTSAAEVKAPEPDGSYDAAKVAEEGALPDLWLGDENAPVTIVEYASATCGHCATFHNDTWPELKKRYVETGKVRFVLREFPFDPRATAAFMLARCSGDNYHPLVDVLFKTQRNWAGAPGDQFLSTLYNTVKIAGFSQEDFNACLRDQELLDKVNAVRNRAADEFGIEATPTFLINGKKYAGAMPIEQFAAIIDSME